MDNVIIHKTLAIINGNGQEYWLNLVDGKLETGGDLPMTEAADIFFREIKRIAEKSSQIDHAIEAE